MNRRIDDLKLSSTISIQQTMQRGKKMTTIDFAFN